MAELDGYEVLERGEPLATARRAMVMVHGRGATAPDILTLVPELDVSGVAYIAPQAAGGAWYPNPFTAPLESNQPHLNRALSMLRHLIAGIEEWMPADRVFLLGFSQGACLMLEFAARHARRYGGVFGLSGGLIGPDGTPREYAGGFEQAPVFLGCSDVDPYINRARVEEAAEVFTRLGAQVVFRLYPGMGHLVSPDEIAYVRKVVGGPGRGPGPKAA